MTVDQARNIAFAALFVGVGVVYWSERTDQQPTSIEELVAEVRTRTEQQRDEMRARAEQGDAEAQSSLTPIRSNPPRQSPYLLLPQYSDSANAYRPVFERRSAAW